MHDRARHEALVAIPDRALDDPRASAFSPEQQLIEREERTGLPGGHALGDRTPRDTLAAITASGLTIDRYTRFASGPGRMGVPIVTGIARRLV